MKRKTIKIVVAILLIAISVGALTVLFTPKEETKNKVSDFSFSVGSIGTDGKYVKSDKSIYTKDPISALGLEITPDYTFQGTYQVFYYDGEDNFLYSSDKLSGYYTSENVSFSLGADSHYIYARIMVMPTLEKDEKINMFEPAIYARGLTIENSGVDFEIVKLEYFTDAVEACSDCIAYTVVGNVAIESEEKGSTDYDYIILVCENPDLDFASNHSHKTYYETFESYSFFDSISLDGYIVVLFDEGSNGTITLPKDCEFFVYGVNVND